MRELRFVHRVGDGSHLLLETADGGEQFVLAADLDVLDALTAPDSPAELEPIPSLHPVQPVAAAPEPRHAAPVALAPASREPEPVVRPHVDIAPREVQTRVRAGESPDEVAESLGVPVERIMRFAGPVVEERLRIADEARRARARRSGTEGALVVFGEAVDARFGAHGIDATAVVWSARRREDGEWIVTATWHGGTGEHHADWVFHRSSRTVTAVDDTADDLLSDRPIRPVVPPQPERPRLVAAPRPHAGVVAFPVMPEAMTGPLPVLDDVYDQETDALAAEPFPGSGHSDAAHDTPAHDTPAHDDGPPRGPAALTSLDTLDDLFESEHVGFDEPPLPLTISGRAGLQLSSVGPMKRRELHETDEQKAERARIPSWDDIVLGVRRKHD